MENADETLLRDRLIDKLAGVDSAMHHHDRYEAFIRDARRHPALRTAIVHPCSPEAIKAAVEAREANLLDPILVGP